MKFIETYFDRIFCINLDRRTDRWENCVKQFDKFGLTKVERFPAYDGILNDGKVSGNSGCTSSHRALLELCAFHKWPRMLVLEDDFQILHENFHEAFEKFAKLVPEDWDMFYLGGHYAEPPLSRVNEHVIKMGRMLTTSSYGITCGMARRMAPYISGVGPVDVLFGGWHRENKCYILQPRLIVQGESWSDIMEQQCNNTWCMTDTRHENMV